MAGAILAAAFVLMGMLGSRARPRAAPAAHRSPAPVVAVSAGPSLPRPLTWRVVMARRWSARAEAAHWSGGRPAWLPADDVLRQIYAAGWRNSPIIRHDLHG